MEKELAKYEMKYTRISAFIPQDLFIPDDVSIPPKCRVQTGTSLSNYLEVANSDSRNNSIFISGLCGRPKNSRKELSVTISHVFAIYRAFQSNSMYPYALILEDDMRLPFDIEWKKMINTAPENFSILQLISSNGFLSPKLWAQYSIDNLKGSIDPKAGATLWLKRKGIDFWCAGAYIINRNNTELKNRIESIFKVVGKRKLPVSTTFSDPYRYQYLYEAKVIAGYERGCVPKECCEGNPLRFTKPDSKCVLAPRGFQVCILVHS